MKRPLVIVQATIGCLSLMYGGAAIAGTSITAIPALDAHSTNSVVDSQPSLLSQVAQSLLRDAQDDIRFRNYADLFLIDDEQKPPGGLSLDITAAIFGQGETESGPMFGTGGGSPFLNNLNGNGNGNGNLFGGGLSGNGAPVNQNMPGGAGGVGGGGGGGGVPAQSGDSGTALVVFDETSNGARGNGHDQWCCCCCPKLNSSVRQQENIRGRDSHVASGDASSMDNVAVAAAIPLPAPLWLGLAGLATLAWMRRRSGADRATTS
jgi:hypothetical protein